MKSQKYDVNFRVEVKNLSLKDNLISIIMPFPLQSIYQRLIGQYKINPPTGKIKRENKFQNQYIYWNENLKPKEEKIFELKCKVSVKPRNKSLRDNLNLSRFLKSDRFIDSKKVFKISNDLTKETDNPYEKVKILNDYIVNNLEYGNPIKGLYTTKQALENDRVDCGGFDVLLAALCIAQKIRARLISGFFAGFGPNQMHAWLEINLGSQGWIVADPSIEKLSKEGRSKKFAKLGYVGSDRIALSLGHNFKIKIGKKSLNLAILQTPIVSADGKISSDYTFETRAIQ